jgi:hypothetical protein
VENLYRMELAEVVNTQYAFPVGFVLICAVLVFAFGFKSAEQPAFAHLTYTGDDRKPTGKKRKIKDKVVFAFLLNGTCCCNTFYSANLYCLKLAQNKQTGFHMVSLDCDLSALW